MDWGNINPKQGDETGRGGPNDERDDSRSPRDDSDSKTKGAVVWGSPRSEEGWNTRKLSEDPILNPEKSSSSKPCNWGWGIIPRDGAILVFPGDGAILVLGTRWQGYF